jgi:hypothetical protein
MPIPLVDQIRTLHAWSPLLGYLRRISTTLDARDRAVVLGDLAEWLAEKTGTKCDDRLALRFAAVMRTPEGVEFVREIVAIADQIVAIADQIVDAIPQETDS